MTADLTTTPPPGPAVHRRPRTDVLLDIDGVVAPLCDRDPRRDGPWWDTAVHAPVWGLWCWYAPDLVAALNAVATTPGVRMYWATTWGAEGAHALARTVGLAAGPWPALDAPDTGRHGWWKANAAAAHLAGTDADRVVWIDDELAAWSQQPRPAEHPSTRLLTDPRLVTVSPDPARGLTPADLRHLAAHLAG